MNVCKYDRVHACMTVCVCVCVCVFEHSVHMCIDECVYVCECVYECVKALPLSG